ncbi:hypothetical protein [Microbacterium foliorum]|uniref:hypothetical protein n=1 Tax=Microbacterium foliorum TaxID=104336 RepID=UPI0028D45E9A|nr:hypothetical protein [Microbacterium foliorum]
MNGWTPGFGGFNRFALVVLFWVEGEFGEEFAGDEVVDRGVVVVDEADDLGAGVGSSDPEVEESSVMAEGDFAVVVDGVVADAPDVRVVGSCRGWLSG